MILDVPNELQNAKWVPDAINIESTFEMKMNALSKYQSQMRQFGGMERVKKAFIRYHAYWNNCEPNWYIETQFTA